MLHVQISRRWYVNAPHLFPRIRRWLFPRQKCDTQNVWDRSWPARWARPFPSICSLMGVARTGTWRGSLLSPRLLNPCQGAAGVQGHRLVLVWKHGDTNDPLVCIASYPRGTSCIVAKHVVSIPECGFSFQLGLILPFLARLNTSGILYFHLVNVPTYLDKISS